MASCEPTGGITVREYDAIVAEDAGLSTDTDLYAVPSEVFAWLEAQCLRGSDTEGASWVRPVSRRGRRAVQCTGHVGIIRGPGKFFIEILPKISNGTHASMVESRRLLLEMLASLGQFRHLHLGNATIAMAHMPLLEVFVSAFLDSVTQVVKRGIASHYRLEQHNLATLRGKLMIAEHIRQNLCRRDRFHTEHDVFSTDRPENRLIRAALESVLDWCRTSRNQRMARELLFAFDDIRPSRDPRSDFTLVHLDRSMTQYAAALRWTKLILEGNSPITTLGGLEGASLLFPMPALFEAFVSKHLAAAVASPIVLRSQAQERHLVRHQGQDWFRLKPDLLLKDSDRNVLVLDTKWKLLDSMLSNGKDKYGLSQGDMYQLFAYGHGYLEGIGDIALIYPRTEAFHAPLEVFDFHLSDGLRLWVLPFCLAKRTLVVPANAPFGRYFRDTADR